MVSREVAITRSTRKGAASCRFRRTESRSETTLAAAQRWQRRSKSIGTRMAVHSAHRSVTQPDEARHSGDVRRGANGAGVIAPAHHAQSSSDDVPSSGLRYSVVGSTPRCAVLLNVRRWTNSSIALCRYPTLRRLSRMKSGPPPEIRHLTRVFGWTLRKRAASFVLSIGTGRVVIAIAHTLPPAAPMVAAGQLRARIK